MTRKELIARANHFGLNVETHSPGGVGTYYKFIAAQFPYYNSTVLGLAKADAFVDGWVMAQMARPS